MSVWGRPARAYAMTVQLVERRWLSPECVSRLTHVVEADVVGLLGVMRRLGTGCVEAVRASITYDDSALRIKGHLRDTCWMSR